MIKKLFFLLIVIFSYNSLSAQLTKEVEFEKNIFMEGSLRLSFGEKTRLGISPAVNYRISKSLSLGVGVIGEYYSNHDTLNVKYNTGIYGTNIIANFRLGRISEKLNQKTSVYLYFEQEFLNLENKYFTDYNKNGRSWHDATSIGFKVKRKIGIKNKFALSLIMSWNINNSDAAAMIYKNPLIKLGFQF